MGSSQEEIQVLIAEDRVMVAELLQFQLEEMGYTIVGRATDGAQAVEMTKRLHPNLILMDLDMPEMDGIEASRIIQASCPTPIVVLTAFADLERVKAAGAVGVGAYLVKPPDQGHLERAITIAMARFEDLVELRRMTMELSAYDYSVSHDLKNPLNLILPYAELLRREHANLTPGQLEEYTGIIEAQAHRAKDIIESLLLLATPDEIPVEVLEMPGIVEAACKGVDLLVAQYHAEISIPETLPLSVGHYLLVERIWDNYLSNAIKYGGRPPLVELGGELQEDGFAHFWVRDNGAGLSSEEKAQLFNPFTRLSKNKASCRGSGLGLSIARRIVERLGGHVSLESEVGVGSVFGFTLPAA